MSELTVYEKPTCTTCKNLYTLLTERGIDFERVNYHVDPLPESKIRELIAKTGGTAHDVLRKKEPIYKELGLDDREVSDDELIELMAEHPQLLQRPIVERGDRAVLARPVERALDLLDS
jgi:arsenate reductase (glutaredoxin)